MRISKGGFNIVFYPLSYIHFIYSLFVPTFLFVSASTTDRVRCPPRSGGGNKSNTTLHLTTDKYLDVTNPLRQSLRFQRRICQCAWCCLQLRPPFPPTLANSSSFLTLISMMTSNCGLSNVTFVEFSNIYVPTSVYLSTNPPSSLNIEMGSHSSLRIIGKDKDDTLEG